MTSYGKSKKWLHMICVFCCVFLLAGCVSVEVEVEDPVTDNVDHGTENPEDSNTDQDENPEDSNTQQEEQDDLGIYGAETADEIPGYFGEPYVFIGDGEPSFTADEMSTESYEHYGELDELGRCVTAEACIGKDLMPTKDRGGIGQVKPSGWQTRKYDHIQGKYLYNRCHLIGYQLTAEDANKQNLITGTRYLNIEGMLPFENMVADYIKETNNHVMYRVIPVYTGDNLVADGVIMEAKSVEDDGEGISYRVYAYNVQPGVVIDYATGDSEEGDPVKASGNQKQPEETFIINTGTGKFHKENCPSAQNLKKENRKEFKGDRRELIKKGYEPCKKCNP